MSILDAIISFTHSMAAERGEVTEIEVSRNTYEKLVYEMAQKQQYMSRHFQSNASKQVVIMAPFGEVRITARYSLNQSQSPPMMQGPFNRPLNPGSGPHFVASPPTTKHPVAKEVAKTLTKDPQVMEQAKGAALDGIATLFGVTRTSSGVLEESDANLRERILRALRTDQNLTSLTTVSLAVTPEDMEAAMKAAEENGCAVAVLKGGRRIVRCLKCRRVVFGDSANTVCLEECLPHTPRFPKKLREPMW